MSRDNTGQVETLIARCDGTPSQIAEQLENIASRLRNGANGCHSSEDALLRDQDGGPSGVWSMADDAAGVAARVDRIAAVVTLPNNRRHLADRAATP